MTWFKVDDGFWSHEKVIELSAEAGWLWVRAGSYCAHQLTDGLVKAPIVSLLGSTSEVANQLVEAGLWDSIDGGYEFHDWLKYQPTRDEVESKREAWKERQRAARAKRQSQEESRSDTQRDSRVESSTGMSPSPVPSCPVPSPSSTKKGGSAKRGTRIPEPFMLTSDMKQWAVKEVPRVDIEASTRRFVDYWRAESGAKATKIDWVATWRNWLRRDAENTPRSSRPTPTDRIAAILAIGEDEQGAIGS